MTKLYKSRTNVKIDGVCGGIAEYFKIDPTFVRLAAVVLTVFGFSGIIVYIVCMIVMPRAPRETEYNDEIDFRGHDEHLN